MIFHLVFHQSGGQINKVKTVEPHIIITLHCVPGVTRIFVEVLFAQFYPVQPQVSLFHAPFYNVHGRADRFQPFSTLCYSR